MKEILRIFIFSILYYFITSESLLKVALIFLVTLILLISLDFFQRKNCSFKFLLITSFLLLIPLTLNKEMQSIFLPIGYQYIYISIISSLIYIDSRRINLQVSLEKRLYHSFNAALAPTSYLSGPSATFEEINNIGKKNIVLPTYQNLNLQNLQLAISGGMRISLGLYLNTINPNVFHNYFLFGNSFIIYKMLILIVFGFFNFWRYYLLFSGASELCKSFLSLFDIKVIDNFKNPEIAIFYHEIWNKWHLNITKRIKDFVYTPLTLFALRNFNLINRHGKFLIIEGLPVIVLFLVLSLWHGGKQSDFIFGGLSSILTILSRALSQNFQFKEQLQRNQISKEIIRFFSLTLFGIILGIYEWSYQITKYGKVEVNNIILVFVVSLIIYIYYRLKIKFSNFINSDTKLKFLDTYLFLFEALLTIYINLFLIIDLDKINDFIYFAN